MSIKTQISKNILYIFAVTILTSGIYAICDYQLGSVAKELMLNWAQTEAIAIQEGNLLTSITKTQRFLISSSYVKGVRLVEFEQDQIESKIEFGKQFEVSVDDLNTLDTELTQSRIGFLHQRAFYKIPQKENFVLVFDVQSNMITSLFLISSGTIIFLMVYLIWALQRIERTEAKKREDLLKLAVNELLKSESSSSVLETEIPGLVKWWQAKKNEIADSRRIAIEQQSKIRLGEIASHTAHDMRGALRNIRQIIKITDSLPESHKGIIEKSVDRLSKISESILTDSKTINQQDIESKIRTDIAQAIRSVIAFKQAQFGSTIKLVEKINTRNVFCTLDPDQFERSISNLIDNAIEASDAGAIIEIGTIKCSSGVEVFVKDFGKGISNEDLKKIGTKGFSSGKANGNGLGLFYTKRFAEDLGGRFDIASELGDGTCTTLILPTLEIDHEISLAADETLLILDDQKLIRDTVKLKLSEFPDLKYQIFGKSTELERWLATNETKFKLYSDYFLEDEKKTGIQVIQELGIQDKAFIFTSAFDDSRVLNAADQINVKVLSKDQFFNSRITLGGSSD